MHTSQPVFPNCDTEAIEFLGRIQNCGSLLIADATDHRILHASENLAQEGLWQQSLEDVLPNELLPGLQDLSDGEGHVVSRLVSDPHTGALLQRQGNLILIETEPTPSTENHERSPRAWQSRLLACESETELYHTAAAAVDELLGLQRTMVYRFEPDKSGVVMSEILHSEGPKYLGLRFPAGDIPDNARKLYIRNRIRLIHDVEGTTLQVRSAPDAGTPNLQHAQLRAVAPVHLQYLKNMGVRAAVSFPIVFQGQLWGLVSCHHHQPLKIGFSLRHDVCTVMDSFSTRLRQLHLSARMTFLDFKSHQTGRLARQLHQALQQELPTDLADEFMQSAGAEGLAIQHNGVWHLHGLTPDEDHVKQLCSSIPKTSAFGTHITDSSLSLSPDLRACIPTASGVLSLWVHADRADRLDILWFKPEWVRQVNWGGVPPAEEERAKLGPRTSFDLWKAEMRNHSAAWDASASHLAHALVIAWNECVCSGN